MKSLQRILGYENRTPTELYLHGMEGSERLAMEAFEKGTFKKVPPRVSPKKMELLIVFSNSLIFWWATKESNLEPAD